VTAHRIAGTELVAPLTGQILYTCACGWTGRWWNGHAHDVGAKELPQAPRVTLSRDEMRRAIYGDRRR
jgi:hypothetical protein